jgi:ectoine hydroxylase-related dioxygenase (phytanoyl-CoA dioxygenase family)
MPLSGENFGISSAGEKLLSDGYTVVPAALDPSTCDALIQYVHETTDEGRKTGQNNLFGNIQEAEFRHDLKLALSDPVIEALNQLTDRCKAALAPVTTEDARVVEMAAISSDPGALAQPVHADTMHGITRYLQSNAEVALNPLDVQGDVDEDMASIFNAVATNTAVIVTALVALQDISEDMGPTLVWPITNTVEHHAILWDTNIGGKVKVAEADGIFGVKHKAMTLQKGDALMYDSRTMHCGGHNCSQKRRSVFCVSFMGPGVRPDGTTWTMLPQYRNRFNLRDFPISCSSHAVASTLVADGDEDTPNQSPPAREIPPLVEWMAVVQCKRCMSWRPCKPEEAQSLTMGEKPFDCSKVGFSCSQAQGYTMAEIDAQME